MAFYKKMQKAINKKWYPQSVLVGSPVTTSQIAKRLAKESTVAPADVRAVLEALSGVMGEYMSMGRSVKLDGIGTFFFQSSATGNGVDTEDKVSANQINGVKVRFTPETTYRRQGGGRQAVRALTDIDIEWVDVATLSIGGGALSDEDEPGGTTPVTPDPGTGGGDNPGGGGDDGGGDAD